MKITKKWIKEWEPCEEAVEWIEKQDTRDVFKLIDKLRKSDIKEKYSWLYWAIPKLLKSKRNRIKFVKYAAELALPKFEKKHPDHTNLRWAIQKAEDWLKYPIDEGVKVVKDTIASCADAIVRSVIWTVFWITISPGWIIEYSGVPDKIIDCGIKLLKEE